MTCHPRGRVHVCDNYRAAGHRLWTAGMHSRRGCIDSVYERGCGRRGAHTGDAASVSVVRVCAGRGRHSHCQGLARPRGRGRAAVDARIGARGAKHFSNRAAAVKPFSNRRGPGANRTRDLSICSRPPYHLATDPKLHACRFLAASY